MPAEIRVNPFSVAEAQAEATPEAEVQAEATLEAEVQAEVQAEATPEAEVQAEAKPVVGEEIPEPVDKWLGKRLERAKAQVRAEADKEIAYWREQAQKGAATVQQAAPQPSQNRPALGDFNTVEDYTEAVTDWKLNQVLSQREQAQSSQAVQRTYNARADEFAKKNTDFVPTIQHFIQDYSSVPMPEIEAICMESEVGPAIAYHLAKNPETMEKLIEMTPIRRAAELGKLEDKLRPAEGKPQQKVSKAPAPATPVKGAPMANKNLETLVNGEGRAAQAEWRAARAATRKRY